MLATVQRGAAVYFSSFTDPFLPLEEIYHNSQSAAEACVEVGLPIFFLSRLKYPTWAINLLKKNPHSYAQKSINTPSQEDWQKLSPGAMDLEGHFADIRRLKKHGIYVSIQVNPVVAGVTSNEQIIELFRLLRKAGADHVIVKFVEAGYSWAPAMVERMIKRFGDRGLAFASLFQENIGGQRTIVEEYRLQAHDLYAAEAKRLGLTYSVCYEYRYERNEAGEIIDKTGVSIGREVTTSAQCHGHAVPVYVRTGKRFRPLDACPPSGCLYCASENAGQPRCGDTLAGEARALTMADFRKEMFRGI
jgi:DNA repair photolyase